MLLHAIGVVYFEFGGGVYPAKNEATVSQMIVHSLTFGLYFASSCMTTSAFLFSTRHSKSFLATENVPLSMESYLD